MTKKKVILVILDGWGVGKEDIGNPIFAAKPSNMEYLKSNFPSGVLQASGIAVGLPWGEPGNSETGHVTLGAGKVIYQHYPRISLGIRQGTFFQNEVLEKAVLHAKRHNSALHLVGLLTSGNVHSSFEHLSALLDLGKIQDFKNIELHLFTDGKDSPPQSAQNLLKEVREAIQKAGRGRIASLCGRNYGMDRDSHWDLTQTSYEAIMGSPRTSEEPETYIQESYQKNLQDESIKPAMFDAGDPPADNDAIIFFNFREDSIRQLFEAFADPNFSRFPVKKLENIYMASMTKYEEKFPVPAAFMPERIENPLGKVLADNNLRQLRIAETEKYAHVTYFFDGLRETPFKNEYQILIPSKNVPRHDENPEMMAQAITDRALQALAEEMFDFILINYANPDVIAHTGNYEALVRAIKFVDSQIERLVKAVLPRQSFLIITSDHGNAEKLVNSVTGRTETSHDPNPVPIYLVSDQTRYPKPIEKQNEARKTPVGILSDVAPTILSVFGIKKPEDMTGTSLLPVLT